jgi:NAD(P)-dependent dehydrogenase (short-subunit alcohol dehydrogenase family)
MALPLQADVSDLSQVSRMVAKILKVYGTIDILVNNAGILFPTSFEEMTEREWDKVIAVNLKGAFNCCKAVIAVMKKKRYGKIVNISSSAGKSTSTFGGAHYTASKAGLLGLTRHLAREVGRYGINVNAVCPGSIDTPMIRSKFTDEQIRSATEKIPMGRLGTPEEVAYLVLFLASDASSYITGASIDINAGELMV